MKVISQRDMIALGRHVAIGEEIDLPQDQATQFVALGWVSTPPPPAANPVAATRADRA